MHRKVIVLILILRSFPGYAQEDIQEKNCTDTTEISLLFIGDIMQHDSQIAAAYDTVSKRYDYKPCFQYVKPIIQEADIAIANLEVTFGGEPYKGYPQFSAPDELAIALKDAGVDYLVLANNHSYDRGKKGLERTLKLLDTLGFGYTGTFKDSIDRVRRNPLFIKKNNFRIALLNYSYGTNGIKVVKPNVVNSIDTLQIKNDLKIARDSMSDIIIVFMHWGKEYEKTPNSRQRILADFCFAHGTKLVIGSHPHVVQQMEKFYRDTNEVFVAYSLGNYVSNQRKRFTDGGAMLKLTLKNEIDSLNHKRINIEDAGYFLTWVYPLEDSLDKEFYILPVFSFEDDTTFLVKESDRKKMALFANDSRTLFRKNNKGVFEYIYDTLFSQWVLDTANYIKQGVVCSYKIQFFASKGALDRDLYTSFKEKVTVEKSPSEIMRYMLGCFEEKEQAEKVLDRLKFEAKYKDAFIVSYKDGVRVQKKPKNKFSTF